MDKILLNLDTPAIQYLCRKDKRLTRVIEMVGEIEYTPPSDAYAFLVHEIIEQMLSIKAGAKIYQRLLELCNGEINAQIISNLSDDEMRSIGTSGQKVKYIKSLTSAIISNQINLDTLHNMSDSEVIATLTSIKGIGTWTSKMFLIFVLNRPDILPYEDGAFLQTYRWMYKTSDCNPVSIKKRCKKWKPYASIASRYLYRALDLGLTKKEFHLFK